MTISHADAIKMARVLEAAYSCEALYEAAFAAEQKAIKGIVEAQAIAHEAALHRTDVDFADSMVALDKAVQNLVDTRAARQRAEVNLECMRAAF